MSHPKDAWSPALYETFREERLRPFRDLAELVGPAPGMRILDLGCGTGEPTRELHRRLGAAETIGVDSSDAMLAKAAGFAGEGLRFEKGDLEGPLPAGPFDVVFSNAALHWARSPHGEVLARWAERLAPHGRLAFQIPANQDHPAHRIPGEIGAREPYASAAAPDPRNRALPPEEYAAILHRLGFGELRVRLEVYVALVESREDVFEWLRGTTLTSFEQRLPAELWPRFLEDVRGAIRDRLPDERPFFYPFRRILARGRLGPAVTSPS